MRRAEFRPLIRTQAEPTLTSEYRWLGGYLENFMNSLQCLADDPKLSVHSLTELCLPCEVFIAISPARESRAHSALRALARRHQQRRFSL